MKSSSHLRKQTKTLLQKRIVHFSMLPRSLDSSPYRLRCEIGRFRPTLEICGVHLHRKLRNLILYISKQKHAFKKAKFYIFDAKCSALGNERSQMQSPVNRVCDKSRTMLNSRRPCETGSHLYQLIDTATCHRTECDVLCDIVDFWSKCMYGCDRNAGELRHRMHAYATHRPNALQK